MIGSSAFLHFELSSAQDIGTTNIVMHHESKKPLILKGFRSFFNDKKKTVGRYYPYQSTVPYLVEHQGLCSFGAIYLHSLLESELSDSFVWYANLGPTGYTPCEYAFGVGATHLASHRDALTEQSARGSLARAQTRSRLIMQPSAQTGRCKYKT